MDNQKPSSMATLATLAEGLARDLTEEYLQLGKVVEKANSVAAEARGRADAETAIGALEGQEASSSQPDAPNDLRDLIDETADLFVALQNEDKSQIDERRRADLMSLQWLIRSKPRREHSFPQFGRLPPEIRIMIWKEAIPTHRIWRAGHNRFLMPTIGHICQESRDVALKESDVCACVHGRDPHPEDWAIGPRECPDHPTKFDPHEGMLILPCPAYRGAHDIELPLLLSEAPNIVLDVSPLNETEISSPLYLYDVEPQRAISREKWYGLFDLAPSAMRNKTISAMRWPPTLIDRESAPPQVIEQLFRGDAEFVLDLTDTAEVRRVADLTRQIRAFWAGDHVSCNKVMVPGASSVESIADDESLIEKWNSPVVGLLREVNHRLRHQMTNTALPDFMGLQEMQVAEELIQESNIHVKSIHIFALVDPQLPVSSTRWQRHYARLRRNNLGLSPQVEYGHWSERNTGARVLSHWGGS